jgi:hypothetical protein
MARSERLGSAAPRRRGWAPGLIGAGACLALALPARGLAEDAAASDAERSLRLAHLVAEGTWYQRSEAADALANAGTHAAMAGPLLRDTAVTAIGHQDWRLAHLAMDTLSAVAPDKLADCCLPLDATLASGDEQACTQALHLIEQLGRSAAPLAPRLAALTKDKALGLQALQALVDVGGSIDMLPILHEAIASSDPGSVRCAIAGFAGLGAHVPDTIPALCSVIGDPRYAPATLRALSGMGKDAAAAVPAVLKAEALVNVPDRAPYVRTLRAIETEDMPPTCANAAASCDEGHSVRIPLAVLDPDDMPGEMRAAVVPAQLHGRLVMDHLCAVYTAAYGWLGSEPAAVTVTDHAGKSVAATITLTVSADRQPPSLVGISSDEKNQSVVRLAFDKQLQKASAEVATAYAIVPDVTVVSAALRADGQAVELTTSGLQLEHAYTLSVQGVLDAAATPVPCTLSGRPFTVSAYRPGLAVTWFANENFATATTTGVVPALNFPLGPRPRTEHYGARFTGWLTPTVDATLTLQLTSDDGSRLWLDDKLVIDNWGAHSSQAVSAPVTLVHGRRMRLRVDYFNGAADECLVLAWGAPGKPLAIVPASVFTHGG